ncbi:hypothetical protein CHS0354_024276 [Potamilus streckersoni]|uniref:Thiamin pyrophosphokinase catalytic domain-containing protein n=1 Tax=Potamilus streckersoni TaxID=2493646 RepID=A0AAE0SBN5_9BIVA|nr:hypothetical protein CHS0354_024276 [Potamilus streckersoni]
MGKLSVAVPHVWFIEVRKVIYVVTHVLRILGTNLRYLTTGIMDELHRMPLHYLKDDADNRLVLIVLNQPIGPYLQIFKVLWKKAIFKAATDGGVNHLHSELGEARISYLPDIISGDFDSATPSTLEYYSGKGVEIIPTPEQDETDFTKSIRITAEKTKDMQKDAVVILGGFGGRMDHVFANIDTLFVAQKLMPGVPVYLLSDVSLVTLLEKIMKTAELVTALAVIFLVTLTIGEGAPQWRPQGRFGKRYNTGEFMTAMQTFPENSEAVQPLFMEETPTDSMSTTQSKANRVCVETTFAGVFTCYRRRKSTSAIMQTDEDA